MLTTTPKWLLKLERPLGFIAIPQLAILLVTLQGLGFLMVSTGPEWIGQLALIPDAVAAGELWRVITFLALPVTLSPIWVIFALLFLYYITSTLENEWGAFRTTFYVLISWALTVAFSIVFNYPVLSAKHFQSTLFLAAAALYPNQEVLLFVVTVKLKFLALLSVFFIVVEFIRGDWMDRLFLVAIFSNFLLFFGPAALSQVQNALRRRKFRNQFRG